jgi:TM2 domain-containing membrane protein YozV
MHVACPHCQSTVQVDDQLAGLTSRCPLCSGEFRVPPAGAGLPPGTGAAFGSAGLAGQAAPVGGLPHTPLSTVAVARLSLGVVAITLGAFGVHKFILGRNLEGLIMLFCTLLSCFAISPIIWIIGIVEGIIYMIKSDREFEQDYLIGAKGWF